MPLGLILIFVLAGGAALMPALARRRSTRLAGASEYVADRERDRRAEQRARELFGSVAGDEALAMYDELGFVGVRGAGGDPEYGYLIYPHRPIVAYDARSGELLSEYCVRFPDGSEPSAGERLPDADDVLAKWMSLNADERRLLGEANMHLPGRQLDPAMVRRDLVTLAAWLRRRAG